MRSLLSSLVASLVLVLVPTTLLAIAGVTDHVPAASLLVPYFQTGIDAAAHPNDTLLAVDNAGIPDVLFHFQVWDRDGNAVPISMNVTLHSAESWDVAMRDILNTASPSALSALTVGSYYIGFVTIDVVTAATSLNPRQAGYPFSSENALEGYIYYTRLSEGSANGLPMVPLEAVSATLDGYLRDFYSGGSREEIDGDARACADQLIKEIPCTGDNDGLLARIHFRQFGYNPLNGTTRLVIFAWNTFISNFTGPSVYCDAHPATCDSTYPFKIYRPDGTTWYDSPIRLDHVVNTIDIIASTSGWASLWNLPEINADLQVYAFSLNSAKPAANPDLNWDAIFEAYIYP